jgi:hypothetical protein
MNTDPFDPFDYAQGKLSSGQVYTDFFSHRGHRGHREIINNQFVGTVINPGEIPAVPISRGERGFWLRGS